MRKIVGAALAVAACVIGAGLVSPLVTPIAAQSRDNDVKVLLQDIAAYVVRCQAVQASSPPDQVRSCGNEKTELLRRQHELNVGDVEVNAQLSGRGGFGRWP
jgi:hypothetical protein